MDNFIFKFINFLLMNLALIVSIIFLIIGIINSMYKHMISTSHFKRGIEGIVLVMLFSVGFSLITKLMGSGNNPIELINIMDSVFSYIVKVLLNLIIILIIIKPYRVLNR